ncbi:MAG: ASCH domain-containing protein [Candidatus Woesearchaeota archaeon]
MKHLAILSKKGKWLAKILSGEKTIESRWYKSRKTPYQNISSGDVVYFKESGQPVTARAKVSKVLFFSELDERKIKEILKEYGKRMGISYSEKLLGKKFCTLVFLTAVEPVAPFNIDKTGYGLMAAWITVEKVGRMRK